MIKGNDSDKYNKNMYYIYNGWDTKSDDKFNIYA